MKHCYSSLMMLAAVFFTGVKTGYAGNEDRIGQAGSTELLINPFARSSGWATSASTATWPPGCR